MKLIVCWVRKGCSRVGNQERRPILDSKAREGLSEKVTFNIWPEKQGVRRSLNIYMILQERELFTGMWWLAISVY